MKIKDLLKTAAVVVIAVPAVVVAAKYGEDIYEWSKDKLEDIFSKTEEVDIE